MCMQRGRAPARPLTDQLALRILPRSTPNLPTKIVPTKIC